MHYKIYKEIVIIFRYLKKFAKKKELLVLEKRRMDTVVCIQMDRDSGNKKLDPTIIIEYKLIQAEKML